VTDQTDPQPPQYSRTPYGLAILAALAVVITAWVARDFFQPLVPGTRAPNFEIANLDGEMVSLKDHRGKVVLVNIWATWCPPCREEMPSMERLYAAFQGTDFEILAVSVDAPTGEIGPDGREGGDVADFVEEMGLTFPILHDPTGMLQFTYQTTGLPESFLLDRKGVIYKRIAGGTSWDAVQHQESIRRLLGEDTPER
jgi:cytochrome c biogenesis protein CcmG, thiol:disulfide interchange protein DsbE